MNFARSVLSITILLLSLGMADRAEAVNVTRLTTSGPANNCQSSLPVSDGKIRKRPLALVNEGDGNAFVTCSFDLPGKVSSVKIITANLGNAPVTVTCTGITGINGEPLNEASIVSAPMGVGARGSIRWIAINFFTTPAREDFIRGSFNTSCMLPPDTALLFSEVVTEEDVGL